MWKNTSGWSCDQRDEAWSWRFLAAVVRVMRTHARNRCRRAPRAPRESMKRRRRSSPARREPHAPDRLHALEQVRVQPADGQPLGPAAQRQRDLARLVAPRAQRCSAPAPPCRGAPARSAAHRAAAAARAATCGSGARVSAVTTRTYLSAASKYITSSTGTRCTVLPTLGLDHLQLGARPPAPAPAPSRRAQLRPPAAASACGRRLRAAASARCSALHAGAPGARARTGLSR